MHKRVNSDDTARPASAQQNRDDSAEHSDAEAELEVSDDEATDPAVQIANFDWDDLHRRYHAMISTYSHEEAVLMDEWANLMEVLPCPSLLHSAAQLTSMQYFRVWANSGHDHETDRTFQRYVSAAVSLNRDTRLIKSRLQTRTMYVQNEENELENKRNHCKDDVNFLALFTH